MNNINRKRRVVISGLGAVTALGFDFIDIWEAMLDGRSGIQQISSFDLEGYRCLNGAEVDSKELSAQLLQRKIKSQDRTVDMAVLASGLALEEAGLISTEVSSQTDYKPLHAAALFGVGCGSSESVFKGYSSYITNGVSSVRPSTVPRCMANATSAQVSMRYRLTGPNYVLSSACSSSSAAIGAGFRMISNGYIHTAVCGGSDTVFNPGLYAAWNNLGVVSKHADPKSACRPFDAARDGCILGEGAGALVLESLESATNRGAPIRAEICGFGESSDTTHITAPSPEGQARAISAALESAEIQAEEVGFINAHGTATKANDACESQSIRMVFRELADSIPVASNKPFFGHLLGASGAVETMAVVLGLECGVVPPNLNLENPDSQCDLNFIGPQSMPISSPIAVKNSFGFGGNNAVLVLKRWE